MCGIIGYFGSGEGISITLKNKKVNDATTLDVLCEGLRRLEYRGYDSAGIAVMNDHGIHVVKSEGKVKDLETLISQNNPNGKYTLGIAHTRWATHGEPNHTNAHPHLSIDGSIAVVHNGIIENYKTLKNSLQEQGYEFSSNTDSEVIPQLIHLFYKKTNDFELAVQKTLSKLEGAYAFLAIHKDHEKLIGVKQGSPLCFGISDREYIFGSDESPFIDKTRRVIYLDDKDMLTVDKSGYRIKNFEGLNIQKEISEVPYNIEAIGKGGYEHFMAKEIHEQPETVANAFSSRINHIDSLTIDNFPNLPHNINRIIILACGTSGYAALIGRYIIEKNTGIPVNAEYASEFRYMKPALFRNDVVIAISQSGQTADTKGALKLAIDSGCYCAGIVNVVGSEIARLAGKGLYLHAGPEIGVASTKAFTSQVIALNLLNLLLSSNSAYRSRVIEEMKSLPDKLKQTIERTEPVIEEIAQECRNHSNFLYMGRGINYPVALEGALKLKEISYIHAEGYSAGEMKHGPIALIEESMPSLFILSGNGVGYSKTLSNLEEVKARKGRVIALTDNGKNLKHILTDKDYIIPTVETIEELSPVINVVPLQLLAYHVAKERGCEIDKPRNLAKSVTVE